MTKIIFWIIGAMLFIIWTIHPMLGLTIFLILCTIYQLCLVVWCFSGNKQYYKNIHMKILCRAPIWAYTHIFPISDVEEGIEDSIPDSDIPPPPAQRQPVLGWGRVHVNDNNVASKP